MQKIKFFNKDGQPCALSNKFYKGYTIGNIPKRFGFIYDEDKEQHSRDAVAVAAVIVRKLFPAMNMDTAMAEIENMK